MNEQVQNKQVEYNYKTRTLAQRNHVFKFGKYERKKRVPILQSNAVFIPLPKRKEFAIVDPCDFEKVVGYNWQVVRGYIRTDIPANKDGMPTSLHRHVLGLGAGKTPLVDHIDHNKLNNTRENLRICTSAQNSWNRQKVKHGHSKYKGVNSRTYKNKRWTAGKPIHLGSYDTEIEAALAYNEGALKYQGEFAALNAIE